MECEWLEKQATGGGNCGSSFKIQSEKIQSIDYKEENNN